MDIQLSKMMGAHYKTQADIPDLVKEFLYKSRELMKYVQKSDDALFKIIKESEKEKKKSEKEKNTKSKPRHQHSIKSRISFASTETHKKEEYVQYVKEYPIPQHGKEYFTSRYQNPHQH